MPTRRKLRRRKRKTILQIASELSCGPIPKELQFPFHPVQVFRVIVSGRELELKRKK